MLVLPGHDPRHEESLAMLEGGHWCSRQAVTGDETTVLQTTLGGMHNVYSVTSQSKQDLQAEAAFHVEYSTNGRLWENSQELNSTLHEIGGSASFTSVFQASHIRVRPTWSVWNPCVRLDIIICPVTDTSPPSEVPSVEAPASDAPAPLVHGSRHERHYLPDDRPSAIAMGSLGIILVTSILALFLMLDLPTYRHDINMARSNIRSYMRHRRRRRDGEREIISDGASLTTIRLLARGDKTLSYNQIPTEQACSSEYTNTIVGTVREFDSRLTVT